MEPRDEGVKALGLINLYGPVTEERCEEVIDLMIRYTYAGGDLIQFMISTHGGLVTEMFGVYDVMRMCREDCEIMTFGVGKVMSAGVLLLAAGTKGSRVIGENCKIMMHGLRAGQEGYLPKILHDVEDLVKMEEQYIKCLAAETNMTKAYIKRLFKKQLDVFLTAEEAIDLGIADKIL